MDKISVIRSRTVVLPASNIDTDQIIPARFLTTTTREGLGKQLFSDWRSAPDGSPKADFILNQPAYRQPVFLAVGPNFGCGSSREHAVWGLQHLGIRALIGSSFAIASVLGIFFANQFADRTFSSEKFLAFSHLVGGLAMGALYWVKDFPTFFALMLIHSLFYVPTISVAAASGRSGTLYRV